MSILNICIMHVRYFAILRIVMRWLNSKLFLISKYLNDCRHIYRRRYYERVLNLVRLWRQVCSVCSFVFGVSALGLFIASRISGFADLFPASSWTSCPEPSGCRFRPSLQNCAFRLSHQTVFLIPLLVSPFLLNICSLLVEKVHDGRGSKSRGCLQDRFDQVPKSWKRLNVFRDLWLSGKWNLSTIIKSGTHYLTHLCSKFIFSIKHVCTFWNQYSWSPYLAKEYTQLSDLVLFHLGLGQAALLCLTKPFNSLTKVIDFVWWCLGIWIRSHH